MQLKFGWRIIFDFVHNENNAKIGIPRHDKINDQKQLQQDTQTSLILGQGWMD